MCRMVLGAVCVVAIILQRRDFRDSEGNLAAFAAALVHLRACHGYAQLKSAHSSNLNGRKWVQHDTSVGGL